jgi:hypothetical protein
MEFQKVNTLFEKMNQSLGLVLHFCRYPAERGKIVEKTLSDNLAARSPGGQVRAGRMRAAEIMLGISGSGLIR